MKSKQKDIARILGVSSALVSYLENGKRRPTWTLAKKLSQNFGSDPGWWMDADPKQIKAAIGRCNSEEHCFQ